MDIIINVRMTEAFLMATPWRGQAAYNKSQRHPWMYNARLAGYVTQLYNFTRVRPGSSTVNTFSCVKGLLTIF